jgi:NAD(P)-dependent dehydrogenase (short-subunit alcohol dehydrogenase family)
VNEALLEFEAGVSDAGASVELSGRECRWHSDLADLGCTEVWDPSLAVCDDSAEGLHPIADVLQKEGAAVAADICASQGRAMFVKTDVISEAAWNHLIATTIATYGKLDILVNNAGISGSSVGDELALAGWEKLMAVNATSVFLGTTRAAAQMAKTGGGS